MKTLKISALLALLGLAAAMPAQADDDLWFGVRAGTLGLGLEATWRPVPYLDLRGGLNRFSFDDDGSEAGVNYDGEFDLDTWYATVNLRAPMTPFRLTAGYFSNSNEVNLTSQEGSTIEIGGTVYPVDQVGTLNAAVTFDSGAPYAGVGMDFRIFDTVGLSLDLGVLFQGEPQVGFNASGPIADVPQFQADLEAERQELEAELEDYDMYPVAMLGFHWNF
ncbi:hypothetical protein [Lentisalinibacter sediminis]|uniref:hypothetical protein n=1 Tax=Lentisalinibacter sediminis TaxID=2992237 RepID=UPI0038679B1E